MKVSKVFGFVLCLHLGAIAVLIVQPGCRTTQPPTKTFQQAETLPRAGEDVIPASSLGAAAGLDAAFNAGLDDGLSSPLRPSGEFGEFDQVGTLQPLGSSQMVSVAGQSIETYRVQKGDSLWAIAKRNSISLNELLTLNGLDKNAPLKIGQEIKIPVEGGSAQISTVTADAYQPTTYNTEAQNYSVQRGDTLSRIAKKFDTSVSAIKAANNKTSDMIRVGEELLIPVPASGVSAAPQVKSTATNSASGRTHVVKAGEYPATIARQYGMTSSELLAMNGITDPRALQVGQKLKVSASGSARNVDSKIDTVTPSVTTKSTVSTPNPTPIAPAVEGPVQIRVIEADPLVEDEAASMDTDSMFDDAVEIPVIRMEE